MKKILIILPIVIVIVGGISFLLFKNNNKSLPKEICGYSFERTTEVDSETISFACDNTFSYFYGCGDPVEDSDLCETYTYDGEIIKLNCDDTGYSDEIKILSYDNKEIKLLINGETRKFKKTK